MITLTRSKLQCHLRVQSSIMLSIFSASSFFKWRKASCSFSVWMKTQWSHFSWSLLCFSLNSEIKAAFLTPGSALNHCDSRLSIYWSCPAPAVKSPRGQICAAVLAQGRLHITDVSFLRPLQWAEVMQMTAGLSPTPSALWMMNQVGLRGRPHLTARQKIFVHLLSNGVKRLFKSLQNETASPGYWAMACRVYMKS